MIKCNTLADYMYPESRRILYACACASYKEREHLSTRKGAKTESRSLVTVRTGKYEWHRSGTNLHEMLPRAGRPFVWSTRLSFPLSLSFSHVHAARHLKTTKFQSWPRPIIPTIRSQISGYTPATWISRLLAILSHSRRRFITIPWAYYGETSGWKRMPFLRGWWIDRHLYICEIFICVGERRVITLINSFEWYNLSYDRKYVYSARFAAIKEP